MNVSRIDGALASRPIEWGEIPAKVARVLNILMARDNPPGVASEFFSLDLLAGVTMSDLADARNVGAKRTDGVIQFLHRLINSEVSSIPQEPSGGTKPTTELVTETAERGALTKAPQQRTP